VQQWFQPRAVWFTAVFEISEHCELDFRGRWKRGQLWNVKREPQTGRHKSPVCARLESEVHFGGLPLPFDFVPLLRTLYHVASINGWCKNPMPARIMVEPTCGEPPANDLPPMDAKGSAEAWVELRRRFKLPLPAGHQGGFIDPKIAEAILDGKKQTANGKARGDGVR
jgi:hypothetical protein